MKTSIFKIICLQFVLILVISCSPSSDDNDTPCTYTPTLTTNEVSDITDVSVVFSGKIEAPTCEGTVTSQGFVYARTTLPKIDDIVIEVNGRDISSKSPNLKQFTKYYMRTFFVNPTGEYYGNQVEFTTAIGDIGITTKNAQNITYKSATSGGIITNDGGANIISRGVCWSTSANPTINNFKTVNGLGIGNFNSELTELSEGTTYYARAYATNEINTNYGNEIIIQVPVRIPENYDLFYRVDMHGDGDNPIPFEFQATFITTDENNQRVEQTQTYSGFTSNTDHLESNTKVVQDYKIVGVKIKAISSNIGGVWVKLTNVSTQNKILEISKDVVNSTEITYDFESQTENIIEN